MPFSSIDLSKLESAKVLILGDVMLDSYLGGNTQRISPEAPVPIVHIQDRYHRPGGAANVALNIAALGGHAILMGLIGDDETGVELNHQLQKQGVETCLLKTPEVNTITKLRIMSRNQQLIRLDTEDGFINVDHKELLEKAVQATEQVSVVVLSDYGKGTLGPILERFLAHCHKKNITVLVDPKGCDFSIYRHASLLTPNMSEFEAVMGAYTNEAAFHESAKKLINKCGIKNLLVTRSEKGMSLFQKDTEVFNLGAQVREVYDVTGAGDTVIATLAAGLAANYSLHEATALANIAAGIVVGKMGTATVSVAELQSGVITSGSTKSKEKTGVLSLEDLLLQLQLARAKGETIVMTNGCFDILHAGHVQYLSDAKQKGDRLIVAVNTDASVKRLKGKTRPINKLKNRMTVLAALSSVDWVVSFDEDTPIEPIKKILPDQLIKGGDYKVEDIVGYDVVHKHGGSVHALPFVEGCSTTNVVNYIKDNL